MTKNRKNKSNVMIIAVAVIVVLIAGFSILTTKDNEDQNYVTSHNNHATNRK